MHQAFSEAYMCALFGRMFSINGRLGKYLLGFQLMEVLLDRYSGAIRDMVSRLFFHRLACVIVSGPICVWHLTISLGIACSLRSDEYLLLAEVYEHRISS